MTYRHGDRADIVAGALFIGFGLIFGWKTLDLEMGSALRMGPGAFPAILSVMLILLGLAVLVQGLRRESAGIGTLAWRGMLFILPAPILFGLTVRGLGFVPAIFLTTLMASFAAPRMKPLYALTLAVCVTVFATLVFSYGLSLPYRRFGPWMQF